MALRKKRESREQRQFVRRSTKKRMVLRRPAHLGKVIAILLMLIVVAVLALVWGSRLKADSDAYREAKEMGAWTLNSEIAVAHPVPVPDIQAIAIKPEGNVGDILIQNSHEGVIMTLNTADGTLLYQSALGMAAGRPINAEAVSLAQDVERVQKRDLRVTCAFTVTCFTATDTTTYAYLRGLDLALLREFAEAGMNDLLLFGLPAGDDLQDAQTVEFLTDLKHLFSDLPNPPAIGVALLPESYTTDQIHISSDPQGDEAAGIPAGTVPLYAGNITPARILNICDYLAVDLRSLTPDEVEATLPHIRYAYVRYSLRLLVDKTDPGSVENTLSHGFERVFEMNPPVEAGN